MRNHHAALPNAADVAPPLSARGFIVATRSSSLFSSTIHANIFHTRVLWHPSSDWDLMPENYGPLIKLNGYLIR